VIRVVFASIRDVKRALTEQGDIASDVAFQNDVNALLAAVSRLAQPEPPAARRSRPARR
jgi:hypothetical protein